MNSQGFTREAWRAVKASQLDYLIVGAVPVIYYSFPRATNDADFVVAAPLQAIDRIAAHFPPSFHVDPQPQMELLTGTYRWIVQIEGTTFKIEVFHLSDDPHHQEMFRRRVQIRVPAFDDAIWVPTPEDLVIQKVRWARRKDMDDAQNILSVQSSTIDYGYISEWCVRHGTLDRLADVRQTSIDES